MYKANLSLKTRNHQSNWDISDDYFGVECAKYETENLDKEVGLWIMGYELWDIP